MWQGDHGLQAILDAFIACGFAAKSNDPIAFAKRARIFPIVHSDTGFEVDVSLGALPFEEDLIRRSDLVSYEGVAFRLATSEDLIVMKLIAGRKQDTVDIARLVEAAKGLDWKYIRRHVKAFARELDLPEMVTALNELSGKQH